MGVKTYRNLYPQVYAFENLYTAYRRARRGKRAKASVAAFERHEEEELLALQDELQAQSYQPGKYRTFYIHEPKRRLIAAAPFRDRVVHHALCQVIEPIWERLFIYDSYANRVGKGTHRALDRCQAYARRYPYVLQCDIQQFFPSIDHSILQSILAYRIHDTRVLWLCERILQSGQAVQLETIDADGTDGIGCQRGLPIGNLTSQFWANVYLNNFDHFIQRELHCHAYLRYVDDFLLFAERKETLWSWRWALIEFLAGLRLKLHENRAQVYPVQNGIPFLGFRVYPTHRRLKRRNHIHFRRRLRFLICQALETSEGWASLQASIAGWVNHVRYGDTWGLRRAILGKVCL